MTGDRIEPPIGRLSVYSGPNKKHIYRTEADLRDGLAALAWLHGWEVHTEYVVPKGGRIDVLLVTPGGVHWAIEIKKEIVTQRQARLAYQQAEGYRLHFINDRKVRCESVVTAPVIDMKWASFETLYPAVGLYPWEYVTDMLRGWFMEDLTDPGERLKVAGRRHRSVTHVADLAKRERFNEATARRNRWLETAWKNYPAMTDGLVAELDRMGVLGHVA